MMASSRASHRSRWPRFLTVIAIVSIGGILTAVGLGRSRDTPNDANTTYRYVRAYGELASESRAALPHTEATVRSVAKLTAKSCPDALGGVGTADHNAALGQQIGQAEEEINGALQVAEARATQSVTVRFGRQLTKLRWSDGALTHDVQLLAGVAFAVTRLPVAPDICADMNAWASTGFRQLSMPTKRFNKELESSLESVGGQGDIEGQINRMVSRNATGREQSAMRRSSRGMSRTQERELDAVIAGRNEIFRRLGLRNPKVS